MAAPGTPFETLRACPFVALELDRDKRADQPDYRHRCFAETTPAPRSIAHQEAYCLSPNFAACPVFQDWAVRAAARPVPGAGAAAGPAGAASIGASAPDVDHDLADVQAEAAPAADASASLGASPPLGASAAVGDWSAQTRAEPAAATEPAASAAPPATASGSAIEDLPEDASMTPAGADIAAAAVGANTSAPGVAASPTFATTGWDDPGEHEQLGVFDAPVADDPRSSYGQPDSGYPEPASASAPAFVPPPTSPSSQSATGPERDAAAAAVPAFLAGRAARPVPTTTSMTGGSRPPRPPSAVSREEIVPSWDIDGRYGAEGPPDNRGEGSRVDGFLTAIAVVAILLLGVAAVVFLPGLLNKGTPKTTPGASFTIPSALPSTLASILPTVAPTTGATAAPSVVATVPASVGPVGSPKLYKIKPGDSLQRIANKNGITIQDILDANPGITDPNSIIVGQTIVIPPAPLPSATP